LFVFAHDISKCTARIIKRLVETFHHELWKPIYLGIKSSKHVPQNITSEA